MDADLLFPRLAEVSRERNLPVLVIGGHAVNAYGYARTTLDADFLIPESDLAPWRHIIESWGFVWAMETPAFVKFKYLKPVPEAYTLDLMKVDGSTFGKLWNEKRERSFGSTRLMVANPLHLIALKLHAMRHPARFRQGKDLPDILHLIRICQINTHDPEFLNILHQYASEDTRQLLDQFLRAE